MGPSLGTVSDAVASRLSPAAFAHSERVAATAAGLAVRYGLDVDEARCAGLLHDWHRELGDADLVSRARALGIEVTAVDETVPYLLHGLIAELELPAVFPGLSADVLDAVGAHTYGRVPMSPLAMVVYVADTIEPKRGHPGVEYVRQQVEECSLAELFAEAYAASLMHIVKRRRPIHPATVEVWNQVVSGEDA